MSVKKVGFANRIFVLLLAICIAASAFLFGGVQTHAEDEIPVYSGNASVELNKNVPGFTADEITTSSFESYGELDKLGRVSTAYVVNKNSGKFHYPSCDSVNDMKEKNKEYSTKTRDELITEGKSPCKRCRP